MNLTDFEYGDIIHRCFRCGYCKFPVNWMDVNNCPAYARFCGSPTILVNEKDVSQSSQNESSCCRVYLENPEFKGCPSLDDVVAALQQACALHD